MSNDLTSPTVEVVKTFRVPVHDIAVHELDDRYEVHIEGLFEASLTADEAKALFGCLRAALGLGTLESFLKAKL